MCFFFYNYSTDHYNSQHAIWPANEIGRPRNVATTQTTCNGKMKTKNRPKGKNGDVVSSARRDWCFDDSYVNYMRRLFRMLLNTNFQIANKTIIVYDSVRTRWPHAIYTSFIVRDTKRRYTTNSSTTKIFFFICSILYKN